MRDGDFLYCAPGGIGKNIVAMNRKSGSVIWESKGDSLVNGFCSPILIGNTGLTQYVYQDAGSILALSTSDGTVAWRYPRTERAFPGFSRYGFRQAISFRKNEVKIHWKREYSSCDFCN